MKTDTGRTKIGGGHKEGFDRNSIRVRLIVAFLLFGMSLMAVLWVLQTVFLEGYYELVAERKSGNIIRNLSHLYAQGEDFDRESFCQELGRVSSEYDIFFYMEAVDGSFSIMSTDFIKSGRFLTGSIDIIELARNNLSISGLDKISFSMGSDDNKLLVNAFLVESRYRPAVYFFAVTRLKPLGSAIGILASQLMLVTFGALLFGLVAALWYSKRVASPIAEISRKAKLLGRGGYDVTFTGGSYTEINELADTLTEAAGELKRADILQKDLMANVSHDLRTPLTMIKSYAELIRDISGENKERRDEHLEVIIEETDRLSELVGDILALSRIQSGSEQMEMADVDIQEAAAHVLATYKVLEENADFSFRFIDIGSKVMVEGDERRLQQVFSNLISNAVRYSGDVRDISIEFTLSNGEVRCAVRDKGIGIAAEDLENIWNRYQKASRQGARVTTGGTGLGLSIAREILEHHGAEYGVESKLGEGSCFWFSMPYKTIKKNKKPLTRS